MLRRACLVLGMLGAAALVSPLPGAEPSAPCVRETTWLDSMLASCQARVEQGDPVLTRRPLPDFGRTDLTAMAWIQTTSGGTILAKSPEKGVWVRQGKSLFVRRGHVVFDIGWVSNITSKKTVADGKWHHVALVMQGDNQRMFIDGQPDASGSLSRGPDGEGWVVKIGQTSSDFGGDFRGLIDEVRLYARALPADEIARLAGKPEPADQSGLAGYWPLDSDGRDASGSQNPASLLGGCDFAEGKLGKALRVSGGAAIVSDAPSDPMDAHRRADVVASLASYDLEGLQRMIRYLGESEGPRYPAVRHLAKLEELERRAVELAVKPEGLARWENELATLRRQALVADNPRMGFDKLLLVKRLTYDSNHYYTEYINGTWQPGGNLCTLDLRDGTVRDLATQLQGGVFERFDVSFDARRVVFAWKAGPQVGYRIYELCLDDSRLRQLTFPPPDEEELVRQYRVFDHYHHGTDDMQPCYLPDGGIAFISTRCQYGILCDAPDDFTTTVLYRMDADGGNLRKLTNSSVSEASPAMLPDGRLMYTRWEYVDKGAVSVKCLWAMRPDGSGSSEIYGNDIALPPTLIYGRPIPGEANRYVVLGTPHCPQNGMGTVLRLDMTRNIRTREPMTYVTPYVDIQAEPGFAFRTGAGPWRHDAKGCGPLFKDPYPLSSGLFLVAHKPEGPVWHDAKGYGLYLLNERGDTALLYRDPAISCFLPYPLRARETPPVLASERHPGLAAAHQAVCAVSDVYHGLKDVPRGTIKYLRVLEQIPRPWAARRRWPGDEYDQQHACITKDTHLGLKVQHGVVPVEDDGSASFVVPAEANIFLQVLDDRYMAVQTERTYVNYMPGEVRSCVGCHETPDAAAASPSGLVTKALRRAPSVPGPQPGEARAQRALDYAADVQPVWDKHCVRCHSGPTPDGNLDLSGTLTAMFNVSYESLVPERRKKPRVDRGLLGPVIGENHPKTGNVDYLPARSLGSHASVLVAMLAPGHVHLADPVQAERARKQAEVHREIRLAPEELLKVTNWVDTNCQFYGTYWGRKNLTYREHPNFRPVPTFEMATSRTSPSSEE